MCFLLDSGDAVGPVLPLRVQVSVRKRHQPPAHGEQQPAAHERRGEDDQREAPFQVDQRGEDVLQESALLADVLVRQIARAVLGDEARFVHAVPEHRLAGHPGGQSWETELLRDDAFSRQHLLLLLHFSVQVCSLLLKISHSVRLYAPVHLQTDGKDAKTRIQLFPPHTSSLGGDSERAPPLRRAGTVSSLLLTYSNFQSPEPLRPGFCRLQGLLLDARKTLNWYTYFT